MQVYFHVQFLSFCLLPLSTCMWVLPLKGEGKTKKTGRESKLASPAFPLKSADIFTSASKLLFAKLQCRGRRGENASFLKRSASSSSPLSTSLWTMCNARQYTQVHLQCLLKQTICITVSAPPQVCIHPLNHHQSQPSPSKPAPPRPKYSSRAPPLPCGRLHPPICPTLLPTINSEQSNLFKNSQSHNICKKVANIGLTFNIFCSRLETCTHSFLSFFPHLNPGVIFSQLPPPDLCHLSFFSTPPSPLPILCLLYLLKCSHTTHCGICWHTCAPSAKHEKGRQQRSPRADTSACCVALGCTMLYCGVLCFTEKCAMC